MKAHRSLQSIGLIALFLMTCAAGAFALPLGEELLAPAAPRVAPRTRPEIAPQPAIFSSRQALYAARSADGTHMVAVERGDKGDELWLYSFTSVPELPRLLHASPVRLAAPALNADGTQVVFVDAQDDVKGDIWLINITKPDVVPKRLTGRESADDAPVFTVDGAAVVYQRQLPGSASRELVRYTLKDGRSEPLPIAIDAAFPAPAPDGVRWLFVSKTSDPNGDLWLWNEQTKAVTQLTRGSERDLYPAWESADTVLFTRQSGSSATASGQESGQVFRLYLKRRGDNSLPLAFPLTSTALMAVAPIPAGDHFYFVAGLAGGGQVMSLPASGEIPDRPSIAEQWALARILLERKPADPAHARLAATRVAAREDAPTREGALAGLALAGLMEKAGETARAEEQHAAVAQRYAMFKAEAALAGIAALRVQTARRCSDGVPAQRRLELLHEAEQAMKTVAAGNGDDATARYLIDTGRLLAEYGGGAADQLTAVGLAEQVAKLAGASRPLKAEAALRRAILLAALEKGAGALAALVEVASSYSDQEEWAEAAIVAVLDQVSPRDRADQAALSVLAEQYRVTLPRLAMGAWNRQGDEAYRANEWAKAKDAYRTVLEKFPVAPTPTAAARFALAEVLYREERYAEAKALYETEMSEQQEDTPLYQLARAAYIRKTAAAGENLYRLGEVAAARSVFIDLIRYDGRSVEAHRGYIKSVAAMGQAKELLDLYRKLLASYPDDPVLLYATGLTLTYLPGREHLDEADRLIARSADRMPSSEYPPQTRGYIAEVIETVHGERGGLERALALYRRAWLLNRPLENPENRANLDLNIGNIAYLLGSKVTAWKFYSQRLDAHIPFDNPDTELIFQQRYAAVAFQMREKEAPINGYSRAIQLIESRLNPGRPLDLFGRLSRRVMERYFPATAGRTAAAETALDEQQAITARLERFGATPVEAPPSAVWSSFEASIRSLLDQERALVRSALSWNKDAAKYDVELNAMLAAVEKELDAVPRLVETSAEIHDRLGLAYLEADTFTAAREQFDIAFALNQGLGFTGNLASNRRSASIAAYREAHIASGGEQQRLLRLSRDGFTELLTLIAKHPPTSKKSAKRSSGVINVSANVALDKAGSTDAAFGFSADQEKRLAEIYLARIQSELGEPAAAAALLENQLKRYPADNTKIAVGDLYGVSLLAHRTAHIDYALGDRAKAAAGFQRSTSLSLQTGNPVSSMLNLINWGQLATTGDQPADPAEFLSTEARVARLADSARSVLPTLAYGRYQIDAGALLVNIARQTADDVSRQALLYKALEHLDKALFIAADSGDMDVLYQQRRQRVVARLDRSVILDALGLTADADTARTTALNEAHAAAAYSLEWRALATLGRYEESLKLLEHLPLTEYDLRQGELAERFAPYLEKFAAKNAEQAFALLEKLSELERVQVLGRGAAGLHDPATAALFHAAAPHLAELDRLRGAIAKAPAADKEYLQLRLQQEQAVIDDLFGAKLERIPALYAQAGEGALRLAAASVQLSARSRTEDVTAPSDAFKADQQRFSAVQAAFARECATGKSGKLCRLFVPQPVELIDVQETMPGKTLLRFTPLDNARWLLFTIGGKKGIFAETVDKPMLEARLSTVPAVLAAYENPAQFSAAPVISWGLSATHLVQSLSQRKPFRRQVLDPANWWVGAEPFAKLAPLPGMNERLVDAHTLVLPARAGLLPEVPSLPGGSGYALPLWEDDKGQRHPLADLGVAENLSLIVALNAGSRQAYSLGHVASLLGVPSLLLADGAAGDSKAFVEAYASRSLGDARQQLKPGWLLLGDWGPDAAEAAKLGKSRFTEYGKAGVLAHNAGSYQKALSLFESALTIVTENPSLAKHGTQLHRYARESAFAAGNSDKAIMHADALVKGLAKEKPFSAEHADALLRLGLLQGNAERFSEAAVSLKEGIGIFADLGMAKEQAAALADFGVVMENAVNFSAARTFFEEAAGLRRTLKDDLSLAEQYRNLGRIFDLRLNQYAVAEQYYGQAGELYAKAGNGALEAETMLERGRCQRLLGNFPAADKLYGDALAKVGSKDLRTKMRIVLEQANNAWFQGRYQDAFDLREQVEKSAIAEKWPLEQVMAKNTGGLIWWTLGDNKRAQLELRGALERAEKLAVRRDEVATTLNNIGLVQRESGEYGKALETLEKALAIDRTLGSRWAMAYDLRNLGQTRLKMGSAAAALPLFAEAADMALAIGDKVNLAKIYLARADAEAELKQPGAAAGYRSALEIADALLLREVRWRALFGLARLQKNAGDTATAVTSYQQALETVEGLRAAIKLDQLKDGFLADKMDVYSGLVSLLVDLQRSDEAFAVAERSRSRNLIDILGRQRLSLKGTVDQDLYDRQNRLKEQMLEQENLSVQAVNPKERARYAQALEKLRGDYQDLLIEIERIRPEMLALVKVNPTTLDDIRKLLEPGVVLLSYYQLQDRLLCWKIDHDATSLIIRNIPAKELAAKISSYRRMLQNLEPLEKQSRELYELLVAQPLANGDKIRAVGIVPHGSLHYMAFATLNDGRDYLIDRQKLFYLPAASVLKYTLARRNPDKKLKILAIGNPDLGDSSLDLPFAEREAGTLRWNYPDVTTLTRGRATKSWINQHISEFGVIHIASHGEFDPINPLFSAIRLAKEEKSDGKLQAEEIFGLDIKADLVVLSACQTGLGDIRSGDDVVGMNRAFIFAGTHSLISSLWRVSDVSTAIMMKQFYRNYMTYGKAESLSRAMQHVKNRYPHPGYWGAFVLTGDYQ